MRRSSKERVRGPIVGFSAERVEPLAELRGDHPHRLRVAHRVDGHAMTVTRQLVLRKSAW
jgi:hypothetical protein